MTENNKPEWFEITDTDEKPPLRKVSKLLPISAVLVAAMILGVGAFVSQSPDLVPISSATAAPENNSRVQTPATSNHLRAIATTSTNLNGVTTYTYLAVGDNGTIVRSINGTDWTVQSPSPTSANLNAVAGVNQFLAVGNSGVILTSTDGLIWTSQTLNPAVNLKTLLRADNQYIAVTDTGVIYTSK